MNDEKLGLYDVRETLDEGGMGNVYAAFDPRLRRTTALKVLKRRLLKREDIVHGFLAEAQITGQLEHPSIVPVYEMGDVDGAPFIAMKRIDGRNLFQIAQRRRDELLDPQRLNEHLEVFMKVCEAVAYAHSRGVLHLDIKPANIMVGAFGQVYLMDWGLSRLNPNFTGDPERLIDPGHDANARFREDEVLATPGYMSPEQAAAEHDSYDERTDVFLLGATLYFLLCGQAPYQGLSFHKAAYRAMSGDHPALDTVEPRVPSALVRMVERAMAHDPAKRYRSVLDLRSDISAFTRGAWLERRTFSAGAIIWNEGDVGHCAYIVQSGRCEVFTFTNGERQTLRIVGPGDIFGEIAIFTNEVRTASIRALDDVVLDKVDESVLTAGLGLNSWMGKFVRVLAERFREADQRLRVLDARANEADPDE